MIISAAEKVSGGQIDLSHLLAELGPKGLVVLLAVGGFLLLWVIGKTARRWLAKTIGKLIRKLMRAVVRYATVSMWAGRMRMPVRLAIRLQPERWRLMCEARKLAGLKRMKVRRTSVGIAIRVRFGAGLDLAAVAAKLDQLETGLGLKRKSLRIEPDEYANKATLHVVLRDPLAKPTPWPGHPSADIRVPVSLGLMPHGDEVTLNLRQRIAIAGTSGSGKSVFARVLGGAAALSKNARLTYIDLKKVEAAQWEHLADTATTPAQVESVIAALRERLDIRLKLMAEHGIDDHTPTPADPDEVIVVDEGAELVRAGLDDAITQLTSMAQMGRAAGFHLWWLTQYPTADGMPTGIGTQANCIVALRVENKRVSDVILGQSMSKEGWRADRLKGKGWNLIKDMDHSEPEPSRAYYVSAADVKGWRAPAGSPALAAAPVRPAIEAAPVTVELPPMPTYAPLVGGWDSDMDEAVSLTKVPAQSAGLPAAAPEPELTELSVPDAVRAALADAPSAGMSAAELVVATGRGKSQVYAGLQELTDDGDAVKVGRGRYVLANRAEVSA